MNQISLPLGHDARSASISQIRRKLGALHNDLRSQGYNPGEALRIVGESLLERGPRAVLGTLDVDATAGGDADLTAIALQDFMTGDVRSSLGQYLTPLPVAEFVASCVADLKPKTVVDPFLGSGILLNATSDLLPQARLSGCEVDRDVFRICQVSASLSGKKIDARRQDSFEAWRKHDLTKADVVVANPPFGGHIELNGKFGSTYCSRNLNGTKGAPIELLALELCLDLLRPGGRLVIVLPQSVMTNARYASYRRSLFSNYTLKSWITLPESTFAPFKGVARACVLVIDNIVSESENYSGAYMLSKSVGYDDTGRHKGVSDLPEIAQKLRFNEGGKFQLIDGTALIQVDSVSSDLESVTYHRLGEIAEIFCGKNPQRDAYCTEGPFLLKVGSLDGSFISWRNRDRSRLPESWYWANESKHLRQGDVCFTSTAHKPRYIGAKVDLIEELPAEGAMPSGEVVVIRLKKDSPVHPVMLLLFLRSNSGFEQIQTMVRGSTAHVYPRDLENLMIPDLSRVVDVTSVQAKYRSAEQAYRQYLKSENEALELYSSVFDR